MGGAKVMALGCFMLWWLWEGVKSCGWIFDIVGRRIGLSRRLGAYLGEALHCVVVEVSPGVSTPCYYKKIYYVLFYKIL